MNTIFRGQGILYEKMLLHVKLDRIIFIVALLESVALENTVTVQKSFPESYHYCSSCISSEVLR